MKKSNKNTVIDLKNLAKRYDDEAGVYDALKGIDLKVYEGEFLNIMGPSGSGKSTLMNIIGLLDRPTSGEYKLDDENTEKLKQKEVSRLRRDKIGFVFQNFNLLPRLNLIQNIELPLLYKKTPVRERREKVFAVLKKVGLADKAKSRPNRLSGGQVQRAAIARALVNDPSLVLADEPTGNLDTKTGLEIMKLLKELNEQGVTVILVTHNPELSEFASRTITVRDGKINEGQKK